MLQFVAFCLWIFGGLTQSGIPDTDALRLVVARNPRDAEAHRTLGQAYFRERQSKLALDEYQQALRLEPFNENLYLEAAAIFMDSKLPDQAETVLLQARKRFQNSQSARYNLLYHDLAELWAAIGRVGKARTAMTAALQFQGPVAQSILFKRIGDFNTDLLRLDDARAAYGRALEIDPKSIEIRASIGNLQLLQNKLDEALSEFTRVISQSPRNVAALCGVAEVYQRAGRLEESAAAAARALAVEPGNSRAHYIRGTTLVRLGRSEEGRKELQEYERLQAAVDARNHRLREIQTFLTTGLSWLLQEKYEEAIRTFKDGVALYPDEPELYVNLGLAQSRAGKHRAAIATFQELIARNTGSDTLVHRYLAQEYLSLGETASAAQQQAIYAKKRDAELRGRPPD